MNIDMPTDEQVYKYIDSVPGLRQEWGIPASKRLGIVSFIVMNLSLIALIVAVIVYVAFVNTTASFSSLSGIIIVAVLAYAVSAVRVFQLKSERAELPAFRKALAQKLTGDPKLDVEAQSQVESSFKWESMKFRHIARMIGIAGMLVICINTFQNSSADYARVLLFDIAILAFFAGGLWNNYALKTDILELELVERTRATIKWQTEHPEEMRKEYINENPAEISDKAQTNHLDENADFDSNASS